MAILKQFMGKLKTLIDKELLTKDVIQDKIKAEKNQKYYTGGAIILMFVVLIGMYLVLY